MVMEVEQPRPVNPAMTFDEVSMERSKNFVKALQELKNLRPQLYSAAEYCEKSYIHSEQKQMVLHNLKDYAVRALVNVVDHLGTMAYKLSDLIEQQTLDVSTMELKVSCVNQKLLTCQVYTDKEGLRQQQLLAHVPRHHKRYILPNSVSKKVHFSPPLQTDGRLSSFQARSRLQNSAKALAWNSASETKSTLKGTSQFSTKTDDQTFSASTSGNFHLLGKVESAQTKSFSSQMQLTGIGPVSGSAIHTMGTVCKDASDVFKPLTAFVSFDNQNRSEAVRVPVRSKSVLSAFFVKPKTPKHKTLSAS